MLINKFCPWHWWGWRPRAAKAAIFHFPHGCKIMVLPFLPLSFLPFISVSHLASPKHRGVSHPIQEFCGVLLEFQSSGKEGGVCFQAGKEWFFHFSESVEPVTVVGPGNRPISFLWVTAWVSGVSSHSLWDSKTVRVCQSNE